MNKSIYTISEELQAIINNIEENGGEITEEIEQGLSIKQDELADKIDAYCHVITMTNSDVDCCKNEKSRLNSIQTTKKNIIEKLKERLLDAVNQFGERGKTGNYVLNTSTHKLFTKKTVSCNVDAERLAIIAKHVRDYVMELRTAHILVTGPDIDLSGFVAGVNAQIRAEHGDTFKPFTLQDLNYIKFNVSKSASITDMFSGQYDWMFDAILAPNSTVETEIDKDNLKTNLESYKNLQMEPRTTIGNLEEKQSLIIK